MKKIEIEAGKCYLYHSPFEDVVQTKQVIFIVGKDKFSGQWVATCKEWLAQVDFIDEDDMEFISEIKN